MGFEDIVTRFWKPAPRTPRGGTAPPAAPHAALNMQDARGVSNAARPLKRLLDGQGMKGISIAEWQAVMVHVQGLPADKRLKLAEDLKAQKLNLVTQPDGKLISLFSDAVQVTVDIANKRVRLTEGDLTTVERDGVQEMRVLRTSILLQVDTPKGRQLWNTATGVGSEKGKPLAIRYAAEVPGEAPRKPWTESLPNKLKQPEYNGESDAEWGAMYDDAVRKAGGEVIEPLPIDVDAAIRYNCHSFALTGGAGDLADPFGLAQQPRWLNYPTYRLANGPFEQLKPTQRVRVGDIILYKDGDSATHTGVVKAVDQDGNPSRVEGKFGAWGRYIHDPFDIPTIYGKPAEFFRPVAK